MTYVRPAYVLVQHLHGKEAAVLGALGQIHLAVHALADSLGQHVLFDFFPRLVHFSLLNSDLLINNGVGMAECTGVYLSGI
jgi:hypothetical protein